MTFIFRGGLPVAVPSDFASDPTHRLLVDRLNRVTLYLHAVAILETHPTDGYLAVEVLNGAPWAKRFLNTTARLWAGPKADRTLAARGWRALMHVLNGTRARVGRRKEPPLSAKDLGLAAEALARWRAVVDAVWGRDRTSMTVALFARADGHFRVSAAHRRALRALLRRRGLRRRDLVQAFTSWETGVPLRRLRSVSSVADLVYA